jgi:hypothetical protein
VVWAGLGLPVVREEALMEGGEAGSLLVKDRRGTRKQEKGLPQRRTHQLHPRSLQPL